MTGFSDRYLDEVRQIAAALDRDAVEKLVAFLVEVRESGGRLFILGVGGSAANASHAVNDFRKIADFEAYSPADNVSELTARTNDEGWSTVFEAWLRTSRLSNRDAVLVFSVGGGDSEKQISPNLVAALDFARAAGARIFGVVGRDGGYTAKVADACVVVPSAAAERVTPHTEAFQAVVWHLLVSHPALKREQTRWERESASGSMRRAVFLDRDGTLSVTPVEDGKPLAPPTLEGFSLLPGTPEAVARLKGAGFLLIVFTNQPNVARGNQSRAEVEKMNELLRAQLPLDDILVCYHDDKDHCDCRKPHPGMLTRAAGQYNVDLRASYAVGDRWRDIDAGANAGCRTVWIDQHYSERGPSAPPSAKVASILEAADWILKDAGL